MVHLNPEPRLGVERDKGAVLAVLLLGYFRNLGIPKKTGEDPPVRV